VRLRSTAQVALYHTGSSVIISIECRYCDARVHFHLGHSIGNQTTGAQSKVLQHGKVMANCDAPACTPECVDVFPVSRAGEARLAVQVHKSWSLPDAHVELPSAVTLSRSQASHGHRQLARRTAWPTSIRWQEPIYIPP